jgi:chromosomal replication initiation ATPase DnaA
MREDLRHRLDREHRQRIAMWWHPKKHALMEKKHALITEVPNEVIENQVVEVVVDPVPPRRIIRISDVLQTVAKFYDVPTHEIVGPRRFERLVMVRHVAFYLAHELVGKSYPEIGRRIGNRDHTTVLHGCRRIARLMPQDLSLAYDVAEIAGRLTQTNQVEPVAPAAPAQPPSGAPDC